MAWDTPLEHPQVHVPVRCDMCHRRHTVWTGRALVQQRRTPSPSGAGPLGSTRLWHIVYHVKHPREPRWWGWHDPCSRLHLYIARPDLPILPLKRSDSTAQPHPRQGVDRSVPPPPPPPVDISVAEAACCGPATLGGGSGVGLLNARGGGGGYGCSTWGVVVVGV